VRGRGRKREDQTVEGAREDLEVERREEKRREEEGRGEGLV